MALIPSIGLSTTFSTKLEAAPDVALLPLVLTGQVRVGFTPHKPARQLFLARSPLLAPLTAETAAVRSLPTSEVAGEAVRALTPVPASI